MEMITQTAWIVEDERTVAAVGWYDSDTVSVGEDLAVLLNNSQDCIKLLGINGTVDFMNCAGLAAMQIASFDDVRGRLWWDIWPDHSRQMVRRYFDRAAGGRELSFFASCPTALGELREWEVRLEPMTTRDGRVSGVLSRSTDIGKIAA